MIDPLGAFVPGVDVTIAGRSDGPLAGLTFASKDLFDVEGTVTGAGTSDWAATQAPATRSAWAVETLLDAGATLTAKTITDEISLGLLGINRFQGTPLNPRAPDRVPGGSSSGSAAAVAGGLADCALGTDSGGSVRVPASFTGIYGLRPTHGRIPVAGMMTQSPSFDTVGFFAREPMIFARVGAVLLDEAPAGTLPDEILIAGDCFAIAEAEVCAALVPALDHLKARVQSWREISLAGGALREWAAHQRTLQCFEFSRTFAPWIDAVNPRLSFEVASGLAAAARIEEGDLGPARACRQAVTARFEALLDGRRLLCLPTSPILPIKRNARLSEMRAAVTRIVELTGLAGLSGLPQVNLPLAHANGIPVGLSLIGWRGSDATLLAMAQAWSGAGP